MRIFTHETYNAAWRTRITAVMIVIFMAAISRLATAQIPVTIPASAGGEVERYLRALQLIGQVPVGQWTVRPFGPLELRAMRVRPTDPWRTAIKDSTPMTRPRWSVVAPSASLVVNSSFPYGFNDGPVWAGKGATVSGSAGVAASYSVFSGQISPLGFIAQNASFRLGPNLQTGEVNFGDWARPQYIDLPQRFGPGAYTRLDPGESWIRVDTRPFALGAGSEAEVWGPAVEEPLILGNNAGGFPHAFAGTGAPLNFGVGHLQGRLIWGRLDQSAFVVGNDTAPRHFATGAIGSFAFKHPRGLEIGAARFFHTLWGQGRWNDVPWTRTFEDLLKSQLPHSALNPNGDNPDNQLASLFFRWAPPAAGIEVYGEYGREDHNADLRDLAGEPDHDAAYTVGFQRAWASADSGTVSVFRWELMNSRTSHLSGQTPWYIHGAIRQGHTERGQVLGAPGGYGGGGSTFAFDRYSPGGRTTIRIDRLVVSDNGRGAELPQGSTADVSYALRFERARFTAGGELGASVGIVRELNRYFAGDAWNLNAGCSFSAFRFGAPK